MRTKNKLGFTLSELMAVVIIVAILTVLATGYYRKAVEQSRFTELVSITNAVAESVDRYILDKQLAGVASDDIPKPTFQELDISFPSCGNSRSCTIKGRYQIVIDAESLKAVQGQPIKGMYSDHLLHGGYIISVDTRLSENRGRIACMADTVGMDTDNKGRSFCESMGFTQCTGAEPVVCTKGN